MTKEKRKAQKRTSNNTNKTSIGRSLTVNQKWIPLLFFVLAFLVYSNTIKYDYAIDDSLYVTENQYVQEGISAFHKLISRESLEGYHDVHYPDYRPIVVVSFAIEKSIFGQSPHVNHFDNVFLYALLCMFIFILLRKMFKGYPVYVPAIVVLLFILHPLHTEAVANIKGRDELLCMLFGVLSLISIFKYQQNGKIHFMIFSCAAFSLCFLSKESGIVYVALIPLLIYFFTNASIKRIALLTLPFVGIAGIILIVRMNIVGELLLGKPLPFTDNSLMAATNGADRLATNFTMLLHALWLLFFPITLTWDYSFNQFPIVTWRDSVAILSLLIYLTLAIIALIGIRKKNIFSFAILFYFITYFLTSNLVIKIASSFGERFLFAPSLGFCIALPFLFAKIFKLDFKNTSLKAPQFRYIGTPILALILILYALKTISRNSDWKDLKTITISGIKTSPNSSRVHEAYAGLFRDVVEKSDNPSERNEAAPIALREFQKALDICPDNPDAGLLYYNMAVISGKIGDTANAIREYKKDLELAPGDAKALINCGLLLQGNKDWNGALTYFQQALELKPMEDSTTYFKKIYYNLGVIYAGLADVSNAGKMYAKSLEFDPKYTAALNNYGVILFMANAYDSALVYFKKVIESDPLNSDGYLNSGSCYFNMKKYKEAIPYYEKALQLNPANLNAKNNLAMAIARLGNK